MNAEMDRVHYCILGIGLNVNSSSRQVPEGATSLKCMTGQDVNRIVLNAEDFLNVWNIGMINCKPCILMRFLIDGKP